MLFVLTAFAFANDGPTPELFAEQIDTDVELTLRLHDHGEPGIDSELDLDRDGEEVFGARTFDAAEAVGDGYICWGSDDVMWDEVEPIDCDETPDRCEQCPGDQGVICPIGGCEQWWDLVVTDACVESGSHTWGLSYTGSAYTAVTVDLDVTSYDEECVADPGDEQACGCSTTTSPGYALGSLMLLIGLVARKR